MPYFDIHTHLFPVENGILNVYPGEHPLEVCRQAPYLSVGVHPWYVSRADLFAQKQMVETWLKQPQVIALGESGLDSLCQTPIDVQEEAFGWMIATAETRKLPLLLHVVRSGHRILQIHKLLKPIQPWVIHGFRGPPQEADAYLREGICLSFGAKARPETVRMTPADCLFIETDTSNIPLQDIYRQVAAWREISPEALAAQVNENVARLFFKR